MYVIFYSNFILYYWYSNFMNDIKNNFNLNDKIIFMIFKERYKNGENKIDR